MAASDDVSVETICMAESGPRMNQNGPIYLRTVLPYNTNYYSHEDQPCLPCIKQSYL